MCVCVLFFNQKSERGEVQTLKNPFFIITEELFFIYFFFWIISPSPTLSLSLSLLIILFTFVITLIVSLNSIHFFAHFRAHFRLQKQQMELKAPQAKTIREKKKKKKNQGRLHACE